MKLLQSTAVFIMHCDWLNRSAGAASDPATMKTKLILLFTALLALGSLSSCVDPYYGGGYGYGYGGSYYRPYYGGYGYSRYSSGYRHPSYGYGGHHHGGFGGYSGHHGGYGGGYGGHHGGYHHH